MPVGLNPQTRTRMLAGLNPSTPNPIAGRWYLQFASLPICQSPSGPSVSGVCVCVCVRVCVFVCVDGLLAKAAGATTPWALFACLCDDVMCLWDDVICACDNVICRSNDPVGYLRLSAR